MHAAIVQRQLKALGFPCGVVTEEPGLIAIIVLNDWPHVSVYPDGWMRLARRGNRPNCPWQSSCTSCWNRLQAVCCVFSPAEVDAFLQSVWQD
ncbi:hypothetical protein [Cupriavidus sp. TMH.W2]|uniref:hypothetical protein n=1 Tax=Cupriavidus sp. TMH.W2 TaxID=3434465 RepID=UPI003D7757B6